MSQVMSDPGQTDALAAEYVLGTLDADERTQAQALLEIDQEFVAKVAAWERRLGELHLMVEPVEPDAKIWARIKARMPQPPPRVEAKLPEAPTIPETPAPPAPAEPGPPPDMAATTPPEAARAESPRLAPVDTPALSPTPPASLNPPSSPEAPSISPSLSPLSPPMPGLAASAVPSPTSPSPAPPLPRAAAAPPMPPPIPSPRIPLEELDDTATRHVRRRLQRWRAFASLLVLVVIASAGLVAAWKFVPDRVPPALHPVELMRLVGVTIDARPVRRPAPPESQFDE